MLAALKDFVRYGFIVALFAWTVESNAQTAFPVKLEGPFEVSCEGDFFDPPENECFPEALLGTSTRLKLNSFLGCVDTGIDDYDGIDNYRSDGNEFQMADDGSTGSGLVDFALVNTARGVIRIDYGASRGPSTDVVAVLLLEAELTTDNLGDFDQPCFASPDEEAFRDFNGEVQLRVSLIIEQPMQLTARGGDFDVLSQFDIGDTVPAATYEFTTSTTYSGGGIDSPDEVVLEIGMLEFTMPDCNADGISDLLQADTDGNGVPDDCEQIQNLSAGTGYASLQAAVDAAAEFDEILVRAGTLNESGVFIAKAVEIRGEGMDVTVMDAGGIDRCLFIADGALGTEILDMTFVNGDSLVEGELSGNVLIGNTSNVTFTRCAFRDGRSTNGNGAGIAAFGTNTVANFDQCEFTGNQATFDGGAVILYDTVTATFTDCLFQNNQAGFSGGALLMFGQSSAFLDRCRLIENSATNGGGALAQLDSSVIDLRQCEFRGNTAAGGAAHIAFGDNMLLATNTLFADGVSQGGAAVQLQGTADATLINCTIAGNDAFNTVSAFDPANTLTAINTIFAGNTTFNGPGDPGSVNGTLIIDRCLFPKAIGNNIALDPMFVDAASGDYRVRSASPAIDAGNDTASPQDATDLDQGTRFTDDAGIAGSVIDIGAYEFQGTSCLPDTNEDGVVSPGDFTAWVAAYNLGGPLADQNRDGLVTPSDFTAWVAAYNIGC